MMSYTSALGPLLTGLEHTAIVALGALVLAIVAGFVVGTARAVLPPALDLPLLALVELVRGIPALVLLYLIFFGLPQIGVRLPSDPSAILALGTYAGSLGSEIVRGAIVSIPRGQTEAATALGLSRFATLTLVVIPQALRRMVPPFVALFALIVETSSLSSLIDVRELTQAAVQQREANVALAIPIMLTALVMYFSVNFPISSLARRLERRLA